VKSLAQNSSKLLKMTNETSHIKAFKDPDGHLKEELAKVEAGHAAENIKHLYSIYKDNPKIKWKLAYKDVLGIPLPPAPGMDV
jgi:hypothetical protein